MTAVDIGEDFEPSGFEVTDCDIYGGTFWLYDGYAGNSGNGVVISPDGDVYDLYDEETLYGYSDDDYYDDYY